jgi:hypothetical protein
MDSNCTGSFNSIAFESAHHSEITHASLSSGSIQTRYPLILCLKAHRLLCSLYMSVLRATWVKPSSFNKRNTSSKKKKGEVLNFMQKFAVVHVRNVKINTKIQFI